MKKSLTFIGLGMVFAALLTFLLRLVEHKFFQSNVNMAVMIGVVAVVAVVAGLIMKMNKTLMFLAAGAAIVAALGFVVRLTKFEDNLTLFILFLVVGLVVLVWGIAKKGK